MEDSKAYAIKVSNVKKMYKLGQIGGGTLQADLQSWWAKIRGKDDPNSIIGFEERSHGKTFMALNGIDLTIYQGEAVGIIGCNGAGKSTLLKLLSRVTAPTEGEIDINGRIASMLEVGTGFHAEMTGRENVYLNGAILGMTKDEIDAKMEQIIDFSEVREFIDTPVKRYSSGMFVKLAFSVAAHLDSEIMIMDEVLAVGDMSFQQKCLVKMRESAKEDGKTVLYVSHNMNTIRQLCDRCIVLDQGKVIFEGAVDNAIDVYMGAVAESPSIVDVREYKRAKEIKYGVRISEIALIDRERWRIRVGEKLRFLVKIESKIDLRNVCYRSRVSAADETSVSVLVKPNAFSCKKDETITIELEADVSELVPGKYSFSPLLYVKNDRGGWDYYDRIYKAVTFDVENKPGFNQDIPWEPRWWGYVKLPSLIKIKDIKE